MALTRYLKFFVYGVFSLLYLSGTCFWVLDHFFSNDDDHPAAQIWVLRLHGTVAIGMLMLLGYVLRAHVIPSWRARSTLKKLGKASNQRAGIALSFYLLLIVLTVPGLLYITNDSWKETTEAIHTYLGLGLLVPFAWHAYLRYRQS